jgi:hypothetical protein
MPHPTVSRNASYFERHPARIDLIERGVGVPCD